MYLSRFHISKFRVFDDITLYLRMVLMSLLEKTTQEKLQL